MTSLRFPRTHPELDDETAKAEEVTVVLDNKFSKGQSSDESERKNIAASEFRLTEGKAVENFRVIPFTHAAYTLINSRSLFLLSGLGIVFRRPSSIFAEDCRSLSVGNIICSILAVT